jgi:hypothetical protein
MAVTQLFTSPEVTLNAGQTREIMAGIPAYVTFFEFYGLSRNCRDGPQDMIECGSGSYKMSAAQVW